MAKEQIINRSIYILLGIEIGKKNLALETINTKLKKEFGELNIYKYYGHDFNIGELVSLIRTPSLFGGFRVVHFNSSESLKKADVDLLSETLKTASHDFAIIFLSDEYKIDKKLEDLCHLSQKQTFYEMNDNEKRGYIKKYFTDNDKKITEEAIERILELVDNNSQEMQTACGALAIFYNNSPIINEDNVDELIIYSKEESVFTLFNKLCYKNLESSAEILVKIANSADGISAYSLITLTTQYRKLLSFKYDLKSYNTEEAYRKNAIFGKKNQACFLEASKLYSIAELKQILVQITNIDTLMRSGLSNKQMQRIAIEKLINHICA